MHRFIHPSLEPRGALSELYGAHLVGADGVPVRADVRVQGAEIRCDPRSSDPVGISLLWPVKDFGVVQLQTTRLPARDEPYLLPQELARQQLMRITLKREEWGLFDYSGMDDIAAQIAESREHFVGGLEQQASPVAAARLAEASLEKGLWAAERMAQFHASVFLGRRHQTGGFSKQFLGVAAPTAGNPQSLLRPIADAFNFVRLPLVWRELNPTEHGVKYDAVDAWLKAAVGAKLAVRGGPLLNFGVQFVPDWMYIWENDFESIYDNARDHISKTVQRYAKTIPVWIAASGLHADSVFAFSFEQIMELTRMATGTIKQLAPRSQVLLELTQPWGEYYARNMQTIPPLLYADMAVQGGITFDAFGLQFIFGINSDGYHLRDLLQISALIDKIANLGKPLHVSAVAAPSIPGGANGLAAGGEWHKPWSETVQADWLSAFCEIALSKPYVESVCLQSLIDSPSVMPAGAGVLREDGSPKAVYAKLLELRRRLQPDAGK